MAIGKVSLALFCGLAIAACGNEIEAPASHSPAIQASPGLSANQTETGPPVQTWTLRPNDRAREDTDNLCAFPLATAEQIESFIAAADPVPVTVFGNVLPVSEWCFDPVIMEDGVTSWTTDLYRNRDTGDIEIIARSSDGIFRENYVAVGVWPNSQLREDWLKIAAQDLNNWDLEKQIRRKFTAMEKLHWVEGETWDLSKLTLPAPDSAMVRASNCFGKQCVCADPEDFWSDIPEFLQAADVYSSTGYNLMAEYYGCEYHAVANFETKTLNMYVWVDADSGSLRYVEFYPEDKSSPSRHFACVACMPMREATPLTLPE